MECFVVRFCRFRGIALLGTRKQKQSTPRILTKSPRRRTGGNNWPRVEDVTVCWDSDLPDRTADFAFDLPVAVDLLVAVGRGSAHRPAVRDSDRPDAVGRGSVRHPAVRDSFHLDSADRDFDWLGSDYSDCS